MIQPFASESTEQGDAPRSSVEACQHGELGIGFVLLRRAESDLHTSSPKASNSRWPKRVAVADDEVDREAECLGSHGTCIGGHDKDDAVLPIGPRAVERRSVRRVPVRDHDRVNHDKAAQAAELSAR